MITIKDYNRIMQYINSGNIEELKGYLEEEKSKYIKSSNRNMKSALGAIAKLDNSFPCLHAIKEKDRVVLIHRNSLYAFNSMELIDAFNNWIIQPERKQKLDPILVINESDEQASKFKDFIKILGDFETKSYEPVDTVEELEREINIPYFKHNLRISTKDALLTGVFAKDMYSYSKRIMGVDTTYGMADINGNIKVLCGESSRGKAYILSRFTGRNNSN